MITPRITHEGPSSPLSPLIDAQCSWQSVSSTQAQFTSLLPSQVSLPKGVALGHDALTCNHCVTPVASSFLLNGNPSCLESMKQAVCVKPCQVLTQDKETYFSRFQLQRCSVPWAPEIDLGSPKLSHQS